MYGSPADTEKTSKAPISEAFDVRCGRSIFLFVDIDAADIFKAVAEFFNNEHRCECSVECEDVRPKAS